MKYNQSTRYCGYTSIYSVCKEILNDNCPLISCKHHGFCDREFTGECKYYKNKNKKKIPKGKNKKHRN